MKCSEKVGRTLDEEKFTQDLQNLLFPPFPFEEGNVVKLCTHNFGTH